MRLQNLYDTLGPRQTKEQGFLTWLDTTYTSLMILKGGPSNYSILWKGSKLSFPVSTILIKANKQKVWHYERTLTIESRNVLGLCEKLLPFIIQHYLLLGWPRIISQVLCLGYFQKSSSCTQNQLSKLKLWVFIISKDQLFTKALTSLKFYILLMLTRRLELFIWVNFKSRSSRSNTEWGMKQWY